MNWEKNYRENKLMWGEQPGELAKFACKYLNEAESSSRVIEILDIGCGYGRDAAYLVRNVKCHILGIDNSKEAIAMANKLVAKTEPGARFQMCDFLQMPNRKFEVIFTSNLYQLLQKDDRKIFREVIKKALKRGGILFLNALSTNDPEHFNKGEKVSGDENSFRDEKFLHFCTREELEKDFGFLTIKELFELEYYEPRSNGKTHHHISWMMLGINQLYLTPRL